MKKQFIWPVCAVVAIVVAGAGAAIYTMDRQSAAYTWVSIADDENLRDLSWTRITEKRLAGFYESGVAVTERSDTAILPAAGNGPCRIETKPLRVEGGFLGNAYCLVVERNGRTDIINSPEQLRHMFAPVDSELEAMSFVAVSVPDLAKEKGEDQVVGYTTTTGDGFLVQVVRMNTFGCGAHEPQKHIYKVTRSGHVRLAAFQQVSASRRHCVD